jgi:hypothetical protein
MAPRSGGEPLSTLLNVWQLSTIAVRLSNDGFVRGKLSARLNEVDNRQRDYLTSFSMPGISPEVSGVVLLAFDIGLHIGRGHEPNFMTQFDQLTRPIMGSAARFDTNQRWRKCRKE